MPHSDRPVVLTAQWTVGVSLVALVVSVLLGHVGDGVAVCVGSIVGIANVYGAHRWTPGAISITAVSLARLLVISLCVVVLGLIAGFAYFAFLLAGVAAAQLVSSAVTARALIAGRSTPPSAS